MGILVGLPGGKTAEFPDGMSPELISAELKKFLSPGPGSQQWPSPPKPGLMPDQPGYYNRSGGGEGSILNTPFEWSELPGQWAHAAADKFFQSSAEDPYAKNIHGDNLGIKPEPEPLPEVEAGLRRGYPATMGIGASATRTVPQLLTDPTNILPLTGKWAARAFTPGLVTETGVAITRAKRIYAKEGTSANFWEALADAGITGAFAVTVASQIKGKAKGAGDDVAAGAAVAPPDAPVAPVPETLNPLPEELRTKAAEVVAGHNRERVHAETREAFPNLTETQYSVATWVMDKWAARVKETTGMDLYATIKKVRKGTPEDLNAGTSPQDVRGQSTFMKKATHQARVVIQSFTGHDFSTVVHEFVHAANPLLSRADNAILEGWLGIEGGKWEKPHKEAFAVAFEAYLKDGRAPTPQLAGVFATMKGWMTEIYDKVKGGLEGSPHYVKMNSEVRSYFDTVLGGEKPKGEFTQPRDLGGLPEETFTPQTEYFSLGGAHPLQGKGFWGFEPATAPPSFQPPIGELEPRFAEQPFKVTPGRALKLKEKPLVLTEEELKLQQAGRMEQRPGSGQEKKGRGGFRPTPLDDFELTPEEKSWVRNYHRTGEMPETVPPAVSWSKPLSEAMNWAFFERKKKDLAPPESEIIGTQAFKDKYMGTLPEEKPGATVKAPKGETPLQRETRRMQLRRKPDIPPPAALTGVAGVIEAQLKEKGISAATQLARDAAAGKASARELVGRVLPQWEKEFSRTAVPERMEPPPQVEKVAPTKKALYDVPEVVGDDFRPQDELTALKREANVLSEELKRMPEGRKTTLAMQRQLDRLREDISRREPALKEPEEGEVLKQSGGPSDKDKLVNIADYQVPTEATSKAQLKLHEMIQVLHSIGKERAARILDDVSHYMTQYKMSPEGALDFLRRNRSASLEVPHFKDAFIDAAEAVNSLRGMSDQAKVLEFKRSGEGDETLKQDRPKKEDESTAMVPFRPKSNVERLPRDNKTTRLVAEFRNEVAAHTSAKLLGFEDQARFRQVQIELYRTDAKKLGFTPDSIAEIEAEGRLEGERSVQKRNAKGRRLSEGEDETLKQDRRQSTLLDDLREERRKTERRMSLRTQAEKIYEKEYKPLLAEEDKARATFDDQPLAEKREDAYRRYRALLDEAETLKQDRPREKTFAEKQLEAFLREPKWTPALKGKYSLGLNTTSRAAALEVLRNRVREEIAIQEWERKKGETLKQSKGEEEPLPNQRVFKRGPIARAVNTAIETVKASGVGAIGTSIRNATAGLTHVAASQATGPIAAFEAEKRASRWEKAGRHRDAALERAAAKRFRYVSKVLPEMTWKSAGESVADVLQMFHLGKGSKALAGQVQLLKDAGLNKLAKEIEKFSTTNVQMGGKLDKVKKGLMVFNILGDRTFNSAYIGAHLEAFKKEVGATTHKELLDKLNLDPKLKRRFQWYMQEAGGEAFKTTWQQPFANEAMKSFGAQISESPVKNAVALLVNPFFKATFANLIVGMTEIFPMPALQEGHIMPSFGEFHMSRRVRNSFQHDAMRQQLRAIEDKLPKMQPFEVKKAKKQMQRIRKEMHKFEKSHIYNVHTARARMMLGPALLALGALQRFARGDDGTEFDQLPFEKNDKGKATIGRYVSGSLGEFLLPLFWGDYLGHYLWSRSKGKPFKYETKEGKLRALAYLQQSAGGSRVGIPAPAQEVFGEILESFIKPGASQDADYLKRLGVDAIANVGRMAAQGLPFDISRLVAEHNDPEERFPRRTDTTGGDFTAKEAPGVITKALARGFQSRIPVLRKELPKSPDWKNLGYSETLTPVTDSLTGLTASKIGPIQRFVNAHQGKISMSEILPKRTGDSAYDDIHLREWVKEATPLLGLFDRIEGWEEDLQIREVLSRFKEARADAQKAAQKAYKKEQGEPSEKIQEKAEKKEKEKEISRRLRAQRRATGAYRPNLPPPSPPLPR